MEDERRKAEEELEQLLQGMAATTDRAREIYRAALGASRPFFQAVFSREPTVAESEGLAQWALATWQATASPPDPAS